MTFDLTQAEEFTWHSEIPTHAGANNVIASRRGRLLGGRMSNVNHAVRISLGQKMVQMTSSPVLLGQITDFTFKRDSISDSGGGGTITYPTRAIVFTLPAAMSQTHLIIPTEVHLTGWTGERDSTVPNPSETLKFNCGARRVDLSHDAMGNGVYDDNNHFYDFAGVDRVVRWVGSGEETTAPNRRVIVLPNISSTWFDPSTERGGDGLWQGWQMGEFSSNNCYLGNTASDIDTHFVVEADKDDTTGRYSGTVHCISVYGVVFRKDPTTQSVFGPKKFTTAFSPEDVEDKELWLSTPLADASIGDTDAVSAWPDISGEGNSPDAMNGPPTLDIDATGSANTIPAIVFDGVGDFYQITDNTVADFTATTDSYAIFIVYQCSTDDTGHIVTRTHGSGGSVRQFRTQISSNVLSANFGSASYVGSSSTATGTGFNIAEFLINSNVDKAFCYLNGTYEDSETVGSGVVTNSGPMIGASLNSGDAPQMFFEGKIAEVLIVGHYPSEVEREKIEGYLAHKHGLTANLPSTHPYKTNAPTSEKDFAEYSS